MGLEESGKAIAERPVRSGLFRAAEAGDRPRLLGSRCRETGEYFWPAERMNPNTRRAGTLEPAEIDGRGRIVSYAVVQRGMPGFSSPYALATIQLDQGPTLIAQLEDWKDQPLALGQKVDLVIATVMTERDGTRVIGPKFRPVRE